MKREQRKKTTTTSTVWRPKTTEDDKVQSLSLYDFNVVEGKTTVMMKNIPNKICLRNLLKVLDNHCSLENEKTQNQNLSEPISEYDFVYLPMDFRSGFNLGYAFVNFTSGNAAVKFYHCFHKLKWENIGFSACTKICEVSKARIQGKERLVNHFQRSWFKCYTDEYLPTVFNPPRNGVNSTSTLSFVGQRRVPG
ncbi:terminal ear1-like protein [Thalictrum thalictroides]|uniref:Terminal ear1-like protein n=1 Tax=Thalictrum thalictroides TaxID=46969 RepID=A0A7J6UUW3_THATH|nr:terminal ear1-like protein [Thalictrum thalictroides]